MKSQCGFLLVTAIFLLVILAALGAFILTISGTQQTSSALDVQGARAYQAARAGIDWASYQLLIDLSVLVDATSTGTTTTASVTISHPTAGTNRLMLVGVSLMDEISTAPSVSSITYNGISLSPVGVQYATDNHGRIEIWRLVAPATGTNNVVLTLSGAPPNGATVGVMTFTGVNQVTPLGAFASAIGDSTSPSVTVTSATNELVFDTMVLRDTTNRDLVPGAGQTERWDLFQGAANGGGSTEPGAASVVMSWSFAGGGEWAIGGVSIKPAFSSFATACNPGPTTQNVTGMGGTLSGFTAAVTCSSTTYTEGAATWTVYQITSTGAQGTAGTLDRVERELQATLIK